MALQLTILSKDDKHEMILFAMGLYEEIRFVWLRKAYIEWLALWVLM